MRQIIEFLKPNRWKIYILFGTPAILGVLSLLSGFPFLWLGLPGLYILAAFGCGDATPGCPPYLVAPVLFFIFLLYFYPLACLLYFPFRKTRKNNSYGQR